MGMWQWRQEEGHLAIGGSWRVVGDLATGPLRSADKPGWKKGQRGRRPDDEAGAAQSCRRRTHLQLTLSRRRSALNGNGASIERISLLDPRVKQDSVRHVVVRYAVLYFAGLHQPLFVFLEVAPRFG